MAGEERLVDWLALSLTPGMGPAGMRLLIERFGDPGRVLAARGSELARISGLRQQVIQALCRQPARAAAEEELIRTERAGISILTWDHPAYPPLLRKIPDPPLLLYAKGDLGCLRSPGLGIVGARAATAYGLQIAGKIAGQLARGGLVINSGFALGIDAAAHLGAIQAGGKTVAVLGSGLDVIYPEQNRNLFDKIAETGTLVSEYPMGTRPDGFRFPARNRIISGISLGILVVEAARRSGSLITARHALEHGREVFAVPGRVDSWKSEGTHRLLQEGAKLVYRAEDILEELAPLAAVHQGESPEARPVAVTDEENRLLSILDVYPRSIDDLIQETAWPAGKVNELLLMLELKNYVETLPGKQYRLKDASPA